MRAHVAAVLPPPLPACLLLAAHKHFVLRHLHLLPVICHGAEQRPGGINSVTDGPSRECVHSEMRQMDDDK